MGRGHGLTRLENEAEMGYGNRVRRMIGRQDGAPDGVVALRVAVAVACGALFRGTRTRGGCARPAWSRGAFGFGVLGLGIGTCIHRRIQKLRLPPTMRQCCPVLRLRGGPGRKTDQAHGPDSAHTLRTTAWPKRPDPPDQHSQFPSGDREIPPPNNQINPPWLPCRRRHATPTATSSGIPAKPIRHSVGPCRAPGPVNNQHRAGADPGAGFFFCPVPSRAVPPHYSTPPRPARGDGVHGSPAPLL